MHQNHRPDHVRLPSDFHRLCRVWLLLFGSLWTLWLPAMKQNAEIRKSYWKFPTKENTMTICYGEHLNTENIIAYNCATTSPKKYWKITGTSEWISHLGHEHRWGTQLLVFTHISHTAVYLLLLIIHRCNWRRWLSLYILLSCLQFLWCKRVT